ncbi:MAG: diphthine synthase [Candidatus Altiarchaeota archaeon]|nr:diphthine synthase [Candidatus Altiarchaeota archaeon]
MMLYLIGLGLFDEKDVSVRGIETIKKCDSVYLERYTSPWRGNLGNLEKATGKRIKEVARSDLEEKSKRILEEAIKKDVAVLVPGDPLVATTHSALALEAKKIAMEVSVVHSSSVFSAVAETGLHIYKFGRTATVAYPEEKFFPKTPYTVLGENKKNKSHTLLLLDVKAEDNKFMTINEAVEILLEIEARENENVFDNETFCVGIARLGGDTFIKTGKAKELKKWDFGPPPHILVVPGELHFTEEEFLNLFL